MHNSIKQRLLIVEDDTRLATLVARFFEDAGFEVTIEGHGERVVEAMAKTEPHAILLDINLPGKNGFEICREIRRNYSGKIIMLTAKTAEIDEVLGLELGADDYLAKPVRPRALLTRIQKLLRSKPAPLVAEAFAVGTLWVAPASRELRVRGAPVELTSLEFDMLLFFAQRPGKIISREILSRELRGIEWDGIDRWVDLSVSRLRRKLGVSKMIKTVRNQGYILAAGAQ